MALSVSDLGDLRTYAGLFEIDGTGKTLAAGSGGRRRRHGNRSGATHRKYADRIAPT